MNKPSSSIEMMVVIALAIAAFVCAVLIADSYGLLSGEPADLRINGVGL